MSITSKPILNVHNTTLPNPKEAVQFGRFEVKDNKIFEIIEIEDRIEKEFVSDLLWCNSIKRDRKTGYTMLEMIYFYRGEFHTTTVSREIYNEKGLQILTKLGADIHRTNQNRISQFLRLQERTVENLEYTHKALGWDTAVVAESNLLEYYHTKKYSLNKNSASKYVGEFHISPTGTAEAWLQAIENLVIGRVPLEFALVCGFAAVVNSLLQRFLPLEVIIVHIYGESSSGKTSAAQVAVSGFGRPGKHGLIESWNATFNAMMRTIADVHGVPVVFDEVSIKTNTNLTSIIYQFAEGKERKRLNVEIEFREMATWSGLLLFTAEHPATEKTNQNSGIRVRMPEFHVPNWTDSAEHAQAIKGVFDENYGHGCGIFVEHLIKTFEKEQFIKRYKTSRKKMLQAMDVMDQFSERLAEKYAVFILTAELMNECFPFEIDVEQLLQFIARQEAEMITTRSLEGRALEIIEQQVIKNKAKFRVNDKAFSGTDFYGTIKRKQNYTEVAIVKTVMDQWIKEADFSSKSVVVKQLKAKGILDHEGDRLTRKRKVPITKEEAEKLQETENSITQLVTTTMYVLKLPKEFMNLLDTKEDSNSLEVPITKRPLQKRSLLPSKFNLQSIEEILTDDTDEL